MYTCTGVHVQSTKVRVTPTQVYIMCSPSRPVQHHVHLVTIRRTPVSYIMYIFVHPVQSIMVESAHMQVYIVHHPSRSEMHLFSCVIYL